MLYHFNTKQTAAAPELAFLALVKSGILEIKYKCCDDKHLDNLEILTENLIQAINKSAKDQLCTVGGKKKTTKKKLYPGWKEMVVPYKERAEFWNFLWEEAGKPRFGETFNVMKHTKAQFHYAIRRCKRAAAELNDDKLVESLIKGDKDLFEEVKKNRIKNRDCATSVDGQKGATNISNHFKGQYENLYNQQNSRDEMEEILDTMNNSLADEDARVVNNITADLVKEIIKSKIKPNKADALEDYNSDCLRNGPDTLYQVIAMLFKGLAIHGFMPALLLFCAIIPLVKDPSGSLDSSANYRGIAISSLFLKIWDWIVIMLYGEALSSDELQFGFKKSSSTSLCTWSVVETINYYKRGGSEVFSCLLDCKKAFDTVEHAKIFKKTQ